MAEEEGLKKKIDEKVEEKLNQIDGSLDPLIDLEVTRDIEEVLDQEIKESIMEKLGNRISNKSVEEKSSPKGGQSLASLSQVDQQHQEQDKKIEENNQEIGQEVTQVAQKIKQTGRSVSESIVSNSFSPLKKCLSGTCKYILVIAFTTYLINTLLSTTCSVSSASFCLVNDFSGAISYNFIISLIGFALALGTAIFSNQAKVAVIIALVLGIPIIIFLLLVFYQYLTS
jgi:hypothetical protein